MPSLPGSLPSLFSRTGLDILADEPNIEMLEQFLDRLQNHVRDHVESKVSLTAIIERGDTESPTDSLSIPVMVLGLSSVETIVLM